MHITKCMVAWLHIQMIVCYWLQTKYAEEARCNYKTVNKVEPYKSQSNLNKEIIAATVEVFIAYEIIFLPKKWDNKYI